MLDVLVPTNPLLLDLFQRVKLLGLSVSDEPDLAETSAAKETKHLEGGEGEKLGLARLRFSLEYFCLLVATGHGVLLDLFGGTCFLALWLVLEQ